MMHSLRHDQNEGGSPDDYLCAGCEFPGASFPAGSPRAVGESEVRFHLEHLAFDRFVDEIRRDRGIGRVQNERDEKQEGGQREDGSQQQKTREVELNTF